MSLFKFSIFITLFIYSLSVSAAFSDDECIQKNFDILTSNPGNIFGLFPRHLEVKKEGCSLKLTHTKFKYYKREWEVDFCRGPVHLKKKMGTLSVIRRSDSCTSKNDDFCDEYKDIKEVIQDDGLIFANGEKESLDTDHGKLYCTFLLVNAYLNDGVVFNRSSNYTNYLYRTYSPEGRIENLQTQGPEEASSSGGTLDPNAGPGDF